MAKKRCHIALRAFKSNNIDRLLILNVGIIIILSEVKFGGIIGLLHSYVVILIYRLFYLFQDNYLFALIKAEKSYVKNKFFEKYI